MAKLYLEFWEGTPHEVSIDNGQAHAGADGQGLQPVPSANLTAHHRIQRALERICMAANVLLHTEYCILHTE